MKIIYLLRTQYENMGDLWINRMVLRLLAENFGNVWVDDINVPRGFLDATLEGIDGIKLISSERRFGTRSIRFLLDPRTWKKVPKAVVFPPGHQGSKTLEGSLRGLAGGLCNLVLKVAGFRLIQLGISLAPGGPAERLRQRINDAAFSLISCRDESTFRLLNGVKVIHADLILLATRDIPNQRTAATCRLVYSFRLDHYPHEQRASVVEALKAFMSKLSEVFPDIPKYIVWQVARDESVANLLKPGGDPASIYTLRAIESWKDAEFIYGPGAVVFSNRLHVALTANVVGGVGVAIIKPEYDQKLVGAFQHVRLGENLIPLTSVSAVETTLRTVNELIAHSAARQKTIAEESRSTRDLLVGELRKALSQD